MTTNSGTLPLDKTRRKRLKVPSACGECRRKKTKCNGEKPCSGCIKAKVDCKYVNGSKSRASASSSLSSYRHAASSAPGMSSPIPGTVSSPPAITTTATAFSSVSSPSHPTNTVKRYSSPAHTDKPVSSIEGIEDRLCVIEDILKALLKAGKLPQSPPLYRDQLPGGTSVSLHAPFGSMDRGSVCGEGMHRQQTHLTGHQQHQQPQWPWTRNPSHDGTPLGHQKGMSARPSVFTPTPRRPTWTASQDAFHLPPLQQAHQQPPLTTSCSTSSMSSSSSTSTTSSAMSLSSRPAIHNLLNDEDTKMVLPGVSTLPTPPPTATFYKREGDPYYPRHSYSLPYPTPSS